jgi:LacI family transcriptional regulator
MAATIKDIKEQTGLALATISKYLNGGNVLPENRMKIEAAIKELHYEVNEIARGLITNKTKTIGVIVYSIESLFNGTLLHHIGERLRKSGYGMLICDSSGDEEIEAKNVRFLVNKKVDGMIVIPMSRKAAFLKPAKEAGVPVVLLDRPLEDSEGFDCVKIDNRMAAYRAVNVLLDHDHENIAVICSKEDYTGLERYYGFMAAMADANLNVPEDYQKMGRHAIEFGYEGMKQLLQLQNRPTAVFMTNYEIALGAVMAVNESKYSCPEDISLLGFDELIMSHVVKPQMHMVIQPMKEMGEIATELLLKHIDSKEAITPVELMLGTKISDGNSIRRLGKGKMHKNDDENL